MSEEMTEMKHKLARPGKPMVVSPRLLYCIACGNKINHKGDSYENLEGKRTASNIIVEWLKDRTKMKGMNCYHFQLCALQYLSRLVVGFPLSWPGFDRIPGLVEFVVDKVTPGQVFSEYFGFPCQF
jgi:hypothetical protein